ncbi:alpha/beta fold hydrolase [Aquimarina sp. MMG015]|uniref:alpha/beta fold hydrolase n=1 Tax=Aquimarina sp. MMG015 TaxID=2822689 RepID=UPI001B3A0CC1|nr:alpha/beta fold hydrolase [Aquimarina sp. MMG015]MBQ4803357.1 alpha/beta fold hydrolase [Aquimarina sp. MMG015]
MKNIVVMVLFVLCCFTSIQGQNTSIEETETFFPNADVLKEDTIEYKFLSVPENWDDPKSNTIKIAVCILKNKSNKANADAVVFIQGGPGASGVQNIRSWYRHPLREKNDIVLFDIRGTGFSEPRLCPDLGKKFMEILAKNQSETEDEKQKTAEALFCKQDLLNQGVDIEAYNSLSVSRDLHALKTLLGYSNWHVYGASYGTYMAQVYTSMFPKDIKTLSLDSPISEISTYYTKNTTNYISSLSKVFKRCLSDSDCHNQYPDLETIYYKTIADLEEHPITVKVDKKIIASGEFTYNSEDFKIAIQQALYNKKLVEVIPLLIYQFHERNEDALGNLVAAFSSLLGMDYGVYFCVSCNETLPNNKISEYQTDASKYKGLKGGVAFYKSDFKVCEKWNLNRQDTIVPHDLSKLSSISSPVLVFSGEYDPITPLTNGDKVARKFKKGYTVVGHNLGHVPGFTRTGSKVAEFFINNPNKQLDISAFKKEATIDFVGGVALNPGVSKVGNNLSKINLVFLLPLFVALLIMFVFIFTYVIKLIRKKYKTNSDKIIRVLSILTSIVGITGLISLVLALTKVAGQNYFVLAFGLPENFNYIFTVLLIFSALLFITMLYFIVRIKIINDRSIVFSVLFSNILLVTYLFYWGIL